MASRRTTSKKTTSQRSGAAKSGALSKYVAMRDFTKTPEPSGGRSAARGSDRVPKGALRFVIQMHHATRLHYDFRLEDEGVLKSWAIPKGPTLDVGERRLAMHVEDHPYDYRTFEGIIPKGNYGAGEVIVWDRGWYELAEGTSTTQQIAKGKVKFILHGQKLHGMFTLIHIRGRGGEENAWLLIKDHDEYVDPKWRIEDHNESVKSGKTLADIAKDPSAPHWKSSRPAASRTTRPRRKIEPLPQVSTPMLATLIDKPFDDADWFFEIKWDGYRALLTIDADGTVKATSRNGKDFLDKFPELAELADAFSERPLIVDGEIVALDDEGKASFQALQNRMDRYGRQRSTEEEVTFVAFDLLYGNGRELCDEPLEFRKGALERIIRPGEGVLFSKHVVGTGNALFIFARDQGLEGIIGKRRASRYVERRSRDWVKIKTLQRQEFVVGGWTEPRGSRKAFGALLLGVYEGKQLVPAGSVGTGFDGKTLTAVMQQLRPLERKTTPFAKPIKTDTRPHWIEPKLVAEVTFLEWTRDGQLRAPVFVGVRADKKPRDVVREQPASTRDVA
ncbi:MAG: non-homologous end-joining DNA ligase [Candidatus Eremiobacteraeota bacterium]|nr:non-homologous end-joining DNA ligase [Candidatus Eremiobacteraeota bacterium]